jgi:hypothetical protein
MNKRRLVVRHAVIAFGAHGVLAVGVLSLGSTRSGANVFGWDAVRLLRLVEFPVLWAIDGILQRFLILPVQWFSPHFELGYNSNVALTYVVVGGIFYAALAAGLTLWRNASNSTSNASKHGAATLSQG